MKKNESYGLNKIEIDFDSENLSKLNTTVFDKVAVTAELKYKGNTHHVSLAYAGKSTIDDIKKSYQIHFNDTLFKGRRDYRLSAQSMDKSGIRSLLGFHIYKKNHVISPDIEPVSLYVNNKYQGLYFLIENVDEDFYKKRNIQTLAIYKAKDGNATMDKDNLLRMDSAFSIKKPKKNFAFLNHLIKELHQNFSEDQTESIETLLDLEQYLNYMVATALLSNWDAYRNNYFIYNNSSDKKFRLTPWDLDKVYDLTINTPSELKDYDIYGGSYHSQAILKHKKFNKIYFDLVLKRIETQNVTYFHKKIDEFSETVKAAALADIHLPNSEKEYYAYIEKIKNKVAEWHNAIIKVSQEKLKTPD